jgi:hypothetical protein
MDWIELAPRTGLSYLKQEANISLPKSSDGFATAGSTKQKETRIICLTQFYFQKQSGRPAASMV